jgi:hypothetical protein
LQILINVAFKMQMRLAFYYIVREVRATSITLITIQESDNMDVRSAAPNPGGAPNGTEGAGIKEVSVLVCVPALSVIISVCIDTLGAIDGIAEGTRGWRIGL